MDSFQDWRVRSSHFISQLGVHDKLKFIECLARKLVSKLRVLTSSIASYRNLESMEREAVDIFRKATKLDETFRLARADYQVFITRLPPPQANLPDLGFDFDPQTMEIIRDFPTMSPTGETMIVDLAISPGILKAGNADGTNYGTERILVKLRALCSLQELLHMFAPDHPSPNPGLSQDVMLSSPQKLAPQIKTEPTASTSSALRHISEVLIKREAAGGTDDEVSMLVEPAPQEIVKQQQHDQDQGLCARLPQFLQSRF